MERLVAAGHQPVRSYRPDSETVRESCLDDIDGCDLYVVNDTWKHFSTGDLHVRLGDLNAAIQSFRPGGRARRGAGGAIRPTRNGGPTWPSRAPSWECWRMSRG
jgi:hypothetical protein